MQLRRRQRQREYKPCPFSLFCPQLRLKIFPIIHFHAHDDIPDSDSHITLLFASRVPQNLTDQIPLSLVHSAAIILDRNTQKLTVSFAADPDMSAFLPAFKAMQNRIFHERLQGKLGDRDLIRLFGREIRDQLDVAGAFHLIDSDKFPDIFDFPGKGGS